MLFTLFTNLFDNDYRITNNDAIKYFLQNPHAVKMTQFD